MYKKQLKSRTSITCKNTYKGDTLETRIQKMVNNNEPITDSAPLIYTDRKDGIKAEFDIRTDRFDWAIEQMDKVAGSIRARRDGAPDTNDTEGGETKDLKNPKNKEDGGTEPAQATDNN